MAALSIIKGAVKYGPKVVKKVKEAAEKIKKKTIAEEIEALKQTAAGKRMTTKQLRDRVRIDREHSKKRKSPKRREPSQSSPNPEKAKKRTFKKYNKRFTVRPRGYLSSRGNPLGGMKEGGRVGGKCKVDGIAIRGRTKVRR
jgi:hypothetical protein